LGNYNNKIIVYKTTGWFKEYTIDSKRIYYLNSNLVKISTKNCE